jgi:diadenosine tetraphosphate (Ap4A) HIT family hydrolase
MTTATIRILDIEPASGGHQMVRFKHAGHTTTYWEDVR